MKQRWTKLSNTLLAAGRKANSLLRRLGRASCRLLGKLAAAALSATRSRRAVVSVLLAVIALELCILGVGVVRRLEESYDRAMEAARAELALLEAREFAEERPNIGSAGIGASSSASADEAADDDPAAPPPLRPRDVATIVAQETGETLLQDLPPANQPGTTSTDTPADDGSPSAPGITPTDAAPPADTVAAPPLNQDDAEELDRLIRQGVAAMVAGDMRLCILSLEQARTLSPNHPALLYYYGLAYDKLLNPGKAREYYTKVFHMRDKGGKYFERASRRLTYGFEQPSAMRGKLSFGPHQVRHTYDEEQGENVNIMLPVLLAPGEEVRPDDIYITIQFFDLVNGRKIEFSRSSPKLTWQKEKPDWQDWEENLQITYAVPPLTQEEIDAYGDLKYYGFTAKLYYKGEPLDCISMPSALILQEQRLNSRNRKAPASDLLPDDGLSPEEATPFSDFLNEIDPPDAP